MSWRDVRTIDVHGDKWDMPEGIPIPLARTGLKHRHMRRIGNMIQVESD